MTERYALIDLRKTLYSQEVKSALDVLEKSGVLIKGDKDSEEEFFVIKLKDENADKAICAYGVSCSVKSPELLDFVRDKLSRAGANSKYCKKPD